MDCTDAAAMMRVLALARPRDLSTARALLRVGVDPSAFATVPGERYHPWTRPNLAAAIRRAVPPPPLAEFDAANPSA